MSSTLSRIRYLITVALPLVSIPFASADAAAQELILPPEVGVFALSDSIRYEDPMMGIMYTYSGADRVRANAYVYPVSPERLTGDESQRIMPEVQNFLAALEEGIARGWYSDMEVAVSEGRSFETRAGSRAGHLVVAVFRRGDEAFVSFMHLVVLKDQYVKARLTLPAEAWRTSFAPDFGPDLFSALPITEGMGESTLP